MRPWGRYLAWFAVVCVVPALAAGESPSSKGPPLSEMTTGTYRAGQVWQFRTRPGEEGATLTVGKVESGPGLGVIVHVSVDGLRIKNPGAPRGFMGKVGHLPFSEAALGRSVTKLVGQAKPSPEFGEGYREWRKAFDAGHAGAFTVAVAEVVAFMEQTIAGDAPPPK